jgi:membrane fusion protein (multidrug efflux system)
MKTKINKLKPLCFIILISLLATSCNNKENDNKNEAVAEYKVVTVSPENIVLYREFPVTIEGIENIEIRPKIEGFVEKVLVDEGEFVKKGQLLFILNAPEYEQDVLSTKAAISSAKAEVSTAQLNVEKAKPLVEREIISEFELTAAQNVVTAKKAALEQAQANLSNAKSNLNYTRITAPVSGYIGSLPYKLGSLVSSNTTDPLTAVSNIKQVYAYFSINEKTYLEFLKEGVLKNITDASLLLPDYSLYNQKGKIQTVSGQVDAETGSFNVRAIFENPESLLRTGNSATIQLPKTIKDALVIPQAATYEIQGGVYVYVVDAQSQAKSIKIAVTSTMSGKAYIVTSGLKTNDQVIIEGINTLSSGKKIKAVTVNAADVASLQTETPAATNSSETK